VPATPVYSIIVVFTIGPFGDATFELLKVFLAY